MLLCAPGLSRTKPKKLRAGIFLPDHLIALHLACKNFLCPAQRFRPAVFSAFARSLSADGEIKMLLDTKTILQQLSLRSSYKIEATIMCLRRAKARQKSGPGSLACSGEAFFCLDFFGYFLYQDKK